ncbi:hypothetical protein [Granulicella sp. L60]|uniref:hypothetical protein n=1 Tax=Granulicella sp. L60 TaxID=1641866 RepID=UPI00131DEF94|nr:hypothetical protein [Granulicella sp. L60]
MSATEALSRSAIAGLQKIPKSDDEIAQLLGGLTATETKTFAIAEAAATGTEGQQPSSQAHATAASQHGTEKAALHKGPTPGNTDSTLEEIPPRPAGQLDLTGIFRKVAVESSVQSPQTADAPGRPAREGQNTEAGLGFTQIFQSLAAPRASTNDAQKAAGAAGTSLTDHEAGPRLTNEMSSSAQDDFTSFFERVDARSTDFKRIEEGFPFRTSSPPLAEPVQDGGFTQLLRTLSAEQDTGLPRDLPVNPRTQEMAISSSGPGEFTQIISGSILREMQARVDRQDEPRIQATPAGQLQAETLASHTPVPAEQRLAPHVPAPSVSSAVAPQQWMAAASAHSPSSQVSSLLAHSSQVVPQAMSPHSGGQVAPAAAPPTNRLQQYIPLLLIANLFAMALVLILVTVLLLHR